jgi:hypothetical protein
MRVRLFIETVPSQYTAMRAPEFRADPAGADELPY